MSGKGNRPRWPRIVAMALGVGAVAAAAPALASVAGVGHPQGVTEHPVGTSTAIATHTGRCDEDHDTPDLTSSPPDPATLQLLGVLRRPAATGDAEPLLLDHGLLGLVDVNPTAIRLAGTVAGTRYYVVPAGGMRTPCRSNGRPVVCLFSVRGGGCTPMTSFADTGGGGATQQRKGLTIVAGLVPDGVTSVTVTLGRSHRTFPVTDNLYGYRVSVAPMDALGPVVWHMADGSSRRIER